LIVLFVAAAITLAVDAVSKSAVSSSLAEGRLYPLVSGWGVRLVNNRRASLSIGQTAALLAVVIGLRFTNVNQTLGGYQRQNIGGSTTGPFVLTLADKVAKAHREGGADVSDAEQAAIDEAAAALGEPDQSTDAGA
jgi:hypothetical protein